MELIGKVEGRFKKSYYHIFTLKMASVRLAETLDNFQHSPLLTSES
jgi:hypothetical protein